MSNVKGQSAGILAGRVAVVSGAAANLGLGIVEALAAAGAAVVIGSRRLESAEAVAARLRESGARAIGLRNDVGSSGDVDDLVAHAVREWGRLDIVVHNASSTASSVPTPFTDITDEGWL